MRIDIVVFDGVDELDAVGPLEVLRSAARAGAGFGIRLVTRTPQAYVTGSHGLRFVPDATYSPGADLVLVPGGGWAVRSAVGAWGEMQRGDWLPLLRQAPVGGAVLAGVCTGAMLLAHAGVIGDRRATTHHSAWAELAATGARLVTERVSRRRRPGHVRGGDQRPGPRTVACRAVRRSATRRRRRRADGVRPDSTDGVH